MRINRIAQFSEINIANFTLQYINIDYLTDVDETHFLMTIRVSAKKEVAELYLVK